MLFFDQKMFRTKTKFSKLLRIAYRKLASSETKKKILVVLKHTISFISVYFSELFELLIIKWILDDLLLS